MNFPTISTRLAGVGCLLLAVTQWISTPYSSIAATDDPADTIVWGIDSKDTQLFAIENVDDPHSTYLDYGPLYWDDQGKRRPIQPEGDHQTWVESFTIAKGNIGYLVINRDLSPDHKAPLLARIDLNQVQFATVGQRGHAVEIVGSMASLVDEPGSQITGLAAVKAYHLPNADQDQLVAIITSPSGLSRLVNIDHRDGVALGLARPIVTDGQSLNSARDLAVGPTGDLVVSFADSNNLYRVDLHDQQGMRLNAAPKTSSVLPSSEQASASESDAAPESVYTAMAYDLYKQRWVAFDSDSSELQLLDDDGQVINSVAVEGIDTVGGLAIVAAYQPWVNVGSASPRQTNTRRSAIRSAAALQQIAIGGSLPRAFGGSSGDGPSPAPPVIFPPEDPTPIIPEPATGGLMILGLSLLLPRRKTNNTDS